MIDRLARLADRRGRRVVLDRRDRSSSLAGALGAGVADRLDPYGADDPDTESVIADERLEDAGYRDDRRVVLIEDVDVDARPPGASGSTQLAAELAGDPDVAAVTGFADTGSQAFVSARRRRDLPRGRARRRPTTTRPRTPPSGSPTSLDGRARASASAAGASPRSRSTSRSRRTCARPSCSPSRSSSCSRCSSSAAWSPRCCRCWSAALAIVGTFLMLRVASEMTSVSIFALNLVTGLGLGLAIDYSLFIVSRYREEIARLGPGLEAMRRTMATAGRTVLFSSLTVAGALASLLVFPQRFLYSMGIGGSLVALIAAAIALVVLPAVLALLGERVNSLSPAVPPPARRARRAGPPREGFWYRLSQLVMRFPGRIAAASAALLIALGIPFLAIEFTSVDAQVLPESTSARQVDDALRADFPPFHDTPITLELAGADARRGRADRRRGRADRRGRRRSTRRGGSTAATYAIEAISERRRR